MLLPVDDVEYKPSVTGMCQSRLLNGYELHPGSDTNV